MKNRNLFNRKDLKSSRSSLSIRSTSAESANQPPRPQTYIAISDYNCTAATPPSKGGETFANLRIYNSNLSLAAMPSKGESGVGNPLMGSYYRKRIELIKINRYEKFSSS